MPTSARRLPDSAAAGATPFEFAVSLAAARSEAAALAPIRFRRDHVPVLKAAAAELRARTPEDDVAITGEVVRLYREGASAGEITVVGRVEDAEILRRIWMELPAPDYQAAMVAHQEMRQVTVRGSLVRRGDALLPVPSRGLPDTHRRDI